MGLSDSIKDCLNRKRKAVVVAIRGTMSLADIVTDAVVHPEGIDDWLPPAFSKAGPIPHPPTPQMPVSISPMPR
jgi:hypothetical protein